MLLPMRLSDWVWTRRYDGNSRFWHISYRAFSWFSIPRWVDVYYGRREEVLLSWKFVGTFLIWVIQQDIVSNCHCDFNYCPWNPDKKELYLIYWSKTNPQWHKHTQLVYKGNRSRVVWWWMLVGFNPNLSRPYGSAEHGLMLDLRSKTLPSKWGRGVWYIAIVHHALRAPGFLVELE